MKTIPIKSLWLLLVVLVGCTTPSSRNTDFSPLDGKRKVNLTRTLIAYEKRPPFGIKLEWRLKQGVYSERLKGRDGTYYFSVENNVIFKNSVGKLIESTGGLFVPFDSSAHPWIFSLADYAPTFPLILSTFMTKEGEPVLRAKATNFKPKIYN